MYGMEFSSGSMETTQVSDDLSIETVRSGVIDGHANSKMYENFGVQVGANKLPYQEFGQFNTGSLLNSYRTALRFLTLAHTEGSTVDAIARVGQAYTGMSPVILEPIDNYPGWNLTNITGSMRFTMSNGSDSQRYIYVNSSIGRYGHVLPVTASIYSVGDTINLSYSVLGVNTTVYDEEFYRSGVLLYFFLPSSSVEQTTAIKTALTTAVQRVVPAHIQAVLQYSTDFVTWRPVAPIVDAMVVGSDVFAVSKLGWIYNATPTSVTGSMYVTDVVEIP
jgi:hypothetical protein